MVWRIVFAHQDVKCQVSNFSPTHGKRHTDIYTGHPSKENIRWSLVSLSTKANVLFCCFQVCVRHKWVEHPVQTETKKGCGIPWRWTRSPHVRLVIGWRLHCRREQHQQASAVLLSPSLWTFFHSPIVVRISILRCLCQKGSLWNLLWSVFRVLPCENWSFLCVVVHNPTDLQPS